MLMSLLLALATVASPVVVDRIEGDQAVVEWGARFVDVPLSLLPASTREGSRVVVRVRPSPKGAWTRDGSVLIYEAAALEIPLPDDPKVQAFHSFNLSFQMAPSRRSQASPRDGVPSFPQRSKGARRP